MTETTLFDRLGRDGQLYRKFRRTAAGRLDSDRRFETAKREWESFVRTSHGDVFADIDLENPRERLFIDSLYFDFVVDRLIEHCEREVGCTIVNTEPQANTDALTVDFQSLHEQLVDDTVVADAFEGAALGDTLQTAGTGFLRALYERIISREIRLELGEYYTPRGVAELAVDAIEGDGVATGSVLDPGCGSGVFLAVCLDRKIEALRGSQSPDEIVETVTSSVFGIDLNPVAVKSTKLAYLLSLLPVLDAADTDTVELPVFLTDALSVTRDDTIRFDGQELALDVDVLVGNPPWITWDRLSEAVKDAWRETYADELPLLPHEGASSRLGYANDDISIPFVWVCIHQYLAAEGTASFVLKRDVMKGPAGKLLRTVAVDDRPLAPTHIHDFNTLKPFGKQVGANAAVYTFVADRTPQFPIETTSWTASTETADFSTATRIRETLYSTETAIVPLEDDDTTSAWIRRDAERGAIGDCTHEIRHGVKDDAQAVFSIDRDQLSQLEPDLVYPYLKSKHVVKYGLFGHDLHLVPMTAANEDNEDDLRANQPRTYDYLDSHRDRLAARSSSWLEGGPFYSIFGVGEYTWAEYKVVWCRLGFKPHFAVVSTVDDPDLGEKPVVPGDHCMFISTPDESEAHFLCALLNSSVYQRSLRDIASGGKASLSKTVVSKLALPDWDATAESRRLAELSLAAHEIVADYLDDHRQPASSTLTLSKRAYNTTTIDELAEVQAEIDQLVESLLAGETGVPDDGQPQLPSF